MVLVPTYTAICLLIISALLTGVAIVLAYRAVWWTVILSLAALIVGKLSGIAAIDTSSLIFWSVSSVIVLAINCLLPKQIRDSHVGMSYLCTGALAGSFLGLLSNTTAGVISACAVCIVLAALAFSRQAAGQVLEFPSKKFFNYLCAKGLPLVVIFSMLGILSLHFIYVCAKL